MSRGNRAKAQERKKAPLVITSIRVGDSPSEWLRQVTIQPENYTLYRNARWVMVGLKGSRDNSPWIVYFTKLGGRRSKSYIHVTLPSPPAPEVVAFVRGDMPADVFADWLEEQGVELGTDAYAILRGWAADPDYRLADVPA